MVLQKNAFEWGNNMIPHSEDAVRVTQHVANFLIRQVLSNQKKSLMAYVIVSAEN